MFSKYPVTVYLYINTLQIARVNLSCQNRLIDIFFKLIYISANVTKTAMT